MAIRSSIQSIDYQTLIKNTSIADRASLTSTRSGQALLASLSPTELSAAFPDYYKRSDPDVSGFISAQTKKKQGTVEPSETARVESSGNYKTSAEKTVSAIAVSRQERTSGPRSSSRSSEPHWQTELARQTGVKIGNAEISGPAMEELKREIARGEGDYSAYNRGTAGDTPRRSRIHDIENLTVREVMQLQSLPNGNPNRLMAVGKYQFIPETLKGAVRYSGVELDAKFNAETQEKLFPYLISPAKRPALAAYLSGKSNDRTAALNDLSLEFASMPGPDGKGKYDRDRAGNMAFGGMKRVETLYGTLGKVRQEKQEQLLGRSTVSEPATALPQNTSPQLLEEYNRMSPRQKKNFQEALGKLDQDPSQAINKMNQIYQQNPATVDRAASQGIGFVPTQRQQAQQSVYVGGDSIGVGVAQAAGVNRIANSGKMFTGTDMLSQIQKVPKGSTFQIYAGTNDAVAGITDPVKYEEQMARLSAYAKENNIKLSIHGPHKSKTDWDRKNGDSVDRLMAEAASKYGVAYTSNRSVEATARDGVHFGVRGYGSLAARNNTVAAEPRNISSEQNVGQTQPTAEVNNIPAMADGGSIEGVEDPSKLTAIPMKSGRDDTLLMNNGQPVAKVNSDEKMSYDRDRNRVNVTPKDRANADDLTSRMEERQQEVQSAPMAAQNVLAPTKPMEQVTPYTRERDFVDPVVPTDAALNDSMKRVMSRNEFREEGSHFSFGASNFST